MELNHLPTPYQDAALPVSYRPLEEAVGLEPTRGLPLTVFKTVAVRPNLGLRFHRRVRGIRTHGRRKTPAG